MKKALGKLNQAYILLLVIMSATVTLLGIYQILGRYLFALPIFWTEEVIRYLHIAIIMLGIGFAAQTEAFTTITLISDIVEQKSKIAFKILRVIHYLAQLFFFSLLLYWGYKLTMHAYNQHQLSAAAKLPIYIAYLPLPLGGLMGIVDAVQRIIGLLMAKPPQAQTDEEVYVV